MTPPRRKKSRGNTVMEFALVSVFLIPLLFGTYSIGMSLTKSVQVSVVSRDAGAMFMRYVDFTLPQNKALIVRIASGLGMTANGGNGVVILSQVMYVGDAECATGGYTPGTCPNYHQTVFVKRVVVGNASIYSSQFGTPNSGLLQSDGSISYTNYLTQASCRANNFGSVLSLLAGEYAFISEAFFLTPDLDLPGYRSNTSVYQRNIF